MKIIKLSDIARLITLDTKICLETEEDTEWLNSTDDIVRFLNSSLDEKYDHYEVINISVEDYGWLILHLAKIDE